jgi:hypothetical protein
MTANERNTFIAWLKQEAASNEAISQLVGEDLVGTALKRKFQYEGVACLIVASILESLHEDS